MLDFRLNHFFGFGSLEMTRHEVGFKSGRGDAVWDVVFTRIEWRDISRKWRWREVEQLTIVVVDMVGQLLALVLFLQSEKNRGHFLHTFARFRWLIMESAVSPIHLYKSYWCFGRFLGCWRGTVCLPHVCPEHEVKKPTRMGEDVFSILFPCI